MSSIIQYTTMTGILLLAFSCIPREDPPEKYYYLEEINILPQVLSENSGLTGNEGLIWYINDSGNEPELYGYSREQNTVERTLVVNGVSNVDWEDIAQNEEHLFIGDFGNNSGTRTDLKIILISKSDLQAPGDTIEPYGLITFHYEDQSDFTSSPENTPFDCEAFIVTPDLIFVFTKDWVTLKTKIYSMPVVPGDYTAESVDQWNVDGLVTSAAWSSQSNLLILLGYTPVVPFIWIYSGFDENTLSFENAQRANFENFIGTQTEGISITENGTIVVSSEANITLSAPARLFIVREE